MSKPSAGPIASKILKSLSEQRNKAVDAATLRAGRKRAEEAQKSAISPQELARTAQKFPAHATYIYVQNQSAIMSEQVTELPEMEPFVDAISEAQDEYMPSWPPMSPISQSCFFCWSTYDLKVGAGQETLGQVILSIAAECGVHPSMVALMQALQDSRMGLYRVLEQRDGRARLQDLIGGAPFTAECPSGYSGRAGELWYTRVLPPPAPATDHVLFTSPYVLLQPGVSQWMAYLERALATVSGATGKRALEQHFKWGPSPRYWMEFIFEGYVNHNSGAIFLKGLPDVAESRPCSPSYKGRRS